MTADSIQNVPWLHIRFEGRSYDLPLAALDLGGLSTDDDVRTALRVTWACLTAPSGITLSNGMPTIT